MANLQNKRIKDTYEGLIKTNDNNAISSEVELTDGAGNGTGVSVSTDGRVVASGTVSFGSLKDTGENITITKFVDEADGIANNDNDTSIPTVAAVKDYVDSTELDTVTSVNTQTGDVVLDTDDISEGTSNLYYTEARVSANTSVAANTLKNTYPSADATKVGHITVTQAVDLDTLESDVATNSAKTGITTQQAADIVTNNAKVSFPEAPNDGDAYVRQSEGWVSLTHPADAVTSVNGETGVVVLDSDDITEGTSNLYYTDARVSANSAVTANTAKVGITTQQASDITTNNAKVGITTDQANAITANTAKNSYPTADATKVGFISVTQAVDLDTIESDVATNNAKVGITTQQASDITTNNAKISFDSTSSAKLAGIEAGAEVNPTASEIKTSYESNANTNAFTDAEQTKLSGIATGAEVNTVDSVNGQTGAVSLSTTNISEGTNLYYTDARVSANSDVVANTAKISYNATDSTKVGYISITQAVDLDSVENKQDNQYKIIGVAMDYSNRVLSDSGTAEGTQSIMENIETLILN